ncbi:MAG: histidinol phosphatase [Solirubrobacterales bacterium]|nr:histidinol phosphatase [Solirubrobacterales bacterium]
MDEDLGLALQLADAADEITLARFGATDLIVETKPDLTPVSEADRAVEETLRDRLARERPGDAIFGEEFGGDDVHPPGRRWIIDPIDGTKGYVRGTPVWATLLALEVDGEVGLGVVSAPALGRRWWGSLDGGGAFSDRGPLRVSAVGELADAVFCFGGLEDWRVTDRLHQLLELGSRCWRTRGYGDFWMYMLVAEGAAELACDPAAELWDLAAPLAVVRAAEGRFTDLAGTTTAAGGGGLASNGLVHEAARTILAG